jgi:hypothetical protein
MRQGQRSLKAESLRYHFKERKANAIEIFGKIRLFAVDTLSTINVASRLSYPQRKVCLARSWQPRRGRPARSSGATLTLPLPGCGERAGVGGVPPGSESRQRHLTRIASQPDLSPRGGERCETLAFQARAAALPSQLLISSNRFLTLRC